MKWHWFPTHQTRQHHPMQNNATPDPQQWATPGLMRRVAAIFNDSILVMAVLLMAMTLVVVPLDLILGWENIDKDSLRLNPFYLIYLFCVMVGFHILFWIRGGQTLGMRAWRLRVVREDGEGLGFRDALVRYLCAILSLAALGLGFLWVFIDRDKLTWHDRLSKTRLVIIKKKGSK